LLLITYIGLSRN